MTLPEPVKAALHWLRKFRPKDAKAIKDFIDQQNEKLRRYEEAEFKDQIPMFKEAQGE